MMEEKHSITQTIFSRTTWHFAHFFPGLRKSATWNEPWKAKSSMKRLLVCVCCYWLRQRLNGRGFICKRIPFDEVTLFLYMVPVEFVIETGSFWRPFQNKVNLVVVTAKPHRFKKRLSTLAQNWLARLGETWWSSHEVQRFATQRGLRSLIQLSCVFLRSWHKKKWCDGMASLLVPRYNWRKPKRLMT